MGAEGTVVPGAVGGGGWVQNSLTKIFYLLTNTKIEYLEV